MRTEIVVEMIKNNGCFVDDMTVVVMVIMVTVAVMECRTTQLFIDWWSGILLQTAWTITVGSFCIVAYNKQTVMLFGCLFPNSILLVRVKFSWN